jgi:ubiquinone/menaquinone biosynthesis C-methylase UbiE
MNTAISPAESHYTREHIYEKILAALKQMGVEEKNVTRNDISGVDEFHIRGAEVSKELAAAAGLKSGMKILDVGCGIGGPCRMLAEEYGCHATGIDITGEFIRTARLLSKLVKLENKTEFIHGSALELPFDDESFDAVWTQHVQMNIGGKQKFYREISRVMKKDACFIYYDILSHEHREVYYPVPWANEESLSFLMTRDELKNYLAHAGLKQKETTDQTAKGITYFDTFFKKIAGEGIPKAGLGLLIGESAKEKLGNVFKNLSEKRIVLESGVCVKI